MKVLFLNGSPRKNGSTATIMRKLSESLAKNHLVDWIDVYDLSVKPCQGCLRCRVGQECGFNDDGLRVGRMITQADLIVVGNPSYWSNMTGPLKTLLDRNVAFFGDFSSGRFPKPLLKGKKVIIVTSSGAPWPFNASRRIFNSIGTSFKSSGCKIIGTICHSGTGRKKEIPQKIFNRVEKMGLSI